MIPINWVSLLIFCLTNINHFESSVISMVPVLRSTCHNNDFCAPLANSYCSQEFECTCKKGFFPRNNSCIAEIGTACFSARDCAMEYAVCNLEKCACQFNFAAMTNQECVQKANYGEKCENDFQCSCKNKIHCDPKEPYTDVICARNICSCKEGYHFLSDSFICVKTAKEIRDNCTINENCILIENTQCFNNQCICATNHIEKNGKCLSGIGADCNNDNPCSVVNSICGFFGCECDENYESISVDKCVQKSKLGEDCLKDAECSCRYYDPQCNVDEPYRSLVCLNKSCNCEAGFHYIPNNYTCIRSVKDINESCENNDNCKLLTNTKCEQKKCQCIDNYFAVGGQCKPGLHLSCSSNINCSTVENAECIYNKCQCRKNFVQITTGVCAALRNYGELCQYKEQCPGNRTSFFPPNENLICNGTCSCSKGLRYVADKRACIQSTRNVGENCTMNQNCEQLNNTQCLKNQCMCKENYYFDGEQCIFKSTSPCSKNCSAINLICGSSGNCICEPRYIFAKNNQCIPLRDLGQLCEIDKQCFCSNQKCDVNFSNLVCLNGICSNKTDYNYNETSNIQSTTDISKEYNKNCSSSQGKCKKELDSFCMNDSDCSAVPNAECVKNNCKCKERFVKQSMKLCVLVTSFGKQCEYVEQCTANTANATCEVNTDIAGKICQCRTGQHHHATGCYETRKLHEHCDSLGECFVTSKFDSVKCQGNKCVCAEGFTKINETYCDGAGSIIASVMLIVFMVVFKSAM